MLGHPRHARAAASAVNTCTGADKRQRGAQRQAPRTALEGPGPAPRRAWRSRRRCRERYRDSSHGHADDSAPSVALTAIPMTSGPPSTAAQHVAPEAIRSQEKNCVAPFAPARRSHASHREVLGHPVHTGDRADQRDALGTERQCQAVFRVNDMQPGRRRIGISGCCSAGSKGASARAAIVNAATAPRTSSAGEAPRIMKRAIADRPTGGGDRTPGW